MQKPVSSTSPNKSPQQSSSKSVVRLCVGLDPDVACIPVRFKNSSAPLYDFCCWVVDQTAQYAAAFKINTAFFEAEGSVSWQQMVDLAKYIQKKYPQVLLIADAKRADIGNTNRGYVKAFFDEAGFEAITLNPYLGEEALQPFLEREDKVCILLAKTSNPGSGEFQDVFLIPSDSQERQFFQKVIAKHRAAFADQPQGYIKMWQHVAYRVTRRWAARERCMLVIGATYPTELRQARLICGPKPWFLVPGVGAQGGDTASVLAQASSRKLGSGVLIASSRSILQSSDPATAALELIKLVA